VQIIVRAAVMYMFLWFLTRAMGKKELAQLSVFEMILAVTIGDLVQQGVTQEDLSLTGAMLAVGTFGMIVVAVSLFSYKAPRSRALFEGLPVVVVRDGKVLDRAIRYERLSVEEIKDAARAQGIADLAEVKLCILEPAGSFSFLKDGPPEDQQEGNQAGSEAE
jgi:uncharacterized membrane protein YcaP (DUF421 family)